MGRLIETFLSLCYNRIKDPEGDKESKQKNKNPAPSECKLQLAQGTARLDLVAYCPEGPKRPG